MRPKILRQLSAAHALNTPARSGLFMTGGEISFDFAVDRLETYKGKADFHNLRKVSERGHDIGRLPYSIRILLENAIRHSKRVEGATEAANRLLEWPRSIGSEFPF